jgi:hypothetical protein
MADLRRRQAETVLRHPETRRPSEIDHAKAVLAGDPGPNRRYTVQGSRIADLLVKVGRADLLPAPRAKPKKMVYRCKATNLDGTPCSRGVMVDGDVCHIHAGKVWDAKNTASGHLDEILALFGEGGIALVREAFGLSTSYAYVLVKRAKDKEQP